MARQEAIQEHVRELRSRMARAAVSFAAATALGFYFSPRLLSFLQSDLGVSLHALKAYDVLYTQIMIALLAAFVLTLPYLAWEMLRFAKPGLKEHEYRVIRNYLPFSYLLFVSGAVFAYEFIVKNALRFFRSVTAASDVTAVWGLQSTLGFALRLSAVTGLLFQLPIAAAVLARAGLIDSGMMRRYRVYVVVGVLFMAAVATPPDVVTQLLVTVPVMLLYEASTLIVSRIER